MLSKYRARCYVTRKSNENATANFYTNKYTRIPLFETGKRVSFMNFLSLASTPFPSRCLFFTAKHWKVCEQLQLKANFIILLLLTLRQCQEWNTNTWLVFWIEERHEKSDRGRIYLKKQENRNMLYTHAVFLLSMP